MPDKYTEMINELIPPIKDQEILAAIVDTCKDQESQRYLVAKEWFVGKPVGSRSVRKAADELRSLNTEDGNLLADILEGHLYNENSNFDIADSGLYSSEDLDSLVNSN